MFYFLQKVNDKIESLIQFEKIIYTGNAFGGYNMMNRKIIYGEEMDKGRLSRTYSNEKPGINDTWKKESLGGDLYDLIKDLFE